MHVLLFFGLIPFLKTDAVLDHLLESIKVKVVGSHDVKKQLLYSLVSQIPSLKIRVWTLRTILYKFNIEIGRHPAMPFIEKNFKERGVSGYLRLCQTPMINLFLKDS